MNRKNYKTGDIFSFPISGTEFGFGRVLLDPYEQGIAKNKFDKTSALYFSDKVILVEIYKTTGLNRDEIIDNPEILFPGIFTGNGFIERKLWSVIGNAPVICREIDFPEFISHNGPTSSFFNKGEIKIEIPLPFTEAEEMKLTPRSNPGLVFGELVLYNTGRKNEIQNPNLLDFELRNISNMDLRFSKHKERVYDLLDEDMTEDYYFFAKKKGFDLERLYK